MNFGQSERACIGWRDLRTAARQQKSFSGILLEESDKSRSRDSGRGWVGRDGIWVRKKKPKSCLLLARCCRWLWWWWWWCCCLLLDCFCSVVVLWLLFASPVHRPLFSLTFQLSILNLWCHDAGMRGRDDGRVSLVVDEGGRDEDELLFSACFWRFGSFLGDFFAVTRAARTRQRRPLRMS